MNTRPPHPRDAGLQLRLPGEQRRIHSQHNQLDTLLGIVFQSLDRGSIHMASQAFLRFADAFEAHMEVEESLYFPALHGLRPEIDPELTVLIEEHRSMRADVAAARTLLAGGDRESVRPRLEQLALDISRHEEAEEDLISVIRLGAPLVSRSKSD